MAMEEMMDLTARDLMESQFPDEATVPSCSPAPPTIRLIHTFLQLCIIVKYLALSSSTGNECSTASNCKISTT